MKKSILLILVIALFLLPACGLSRQEREYINDYNYYQGYTLDAVNNLSTLIATWEPDNADWYDNLVNQLVIIGGVYLLAKEMKPPTSMTHIHVKYLRAMSELDSLTELIITGIAYKDEATPEKAIARLDLGMQHLAETQALIDNL